MKTCPNAGCSHRARLGRAATYRDDVTVCSDCGAELATVEDNTQALPVAGLGALPLSAGRAYVRPAAVTFAAVVGLVSLSLVTLPGLDGWVVDDLGGSALGWLGAPPPSLSFAAVTFGPWLAAFLLVELIALLVPRLRPLRDGGPDGRARLLLPTLVLGFVLCGLQAVLHGRSLLAVNALGNPIVTGTSGLLLLQAGVVAGALVSVGLAFAVRRFGLGNGFSVLLAVEALVVLGADALSVWHNVESEVLSRQGFLVAGGLVAAAGFVVWRFVGLDPSGAAGRLPRPLAGTLALSSSYTLLILPTTLSQSLGAAQVQPLPLNVFIVLDVLLVAVLTVAFARLLYRPRRVQETLTSVGVAGVDAAGALRAGIGVALLFSLVLLAVAHLGDAVGVTLDVVLLAVVITVARDLAGELRFVRETGTVRAVWPVHRLYLVEPCLDALERAGIQAYPRGLHHRLLGQLFTPWVPVELLVADADADRARAVIEEMWPS